MSRFTIVVHGGAGRLSREGLSAERQAEIRAGLARALYIGGDILASGGTALAAAVAAVTVLEDDPSFNAGRGSVLNRDGRAEMDASVMDGATRGAGAVAAVRGVKNPVQLAMAVLQETPHVLLAAEGAHTLAKRLALPVAPMDYFITPLRRKQWLAVRDRERAFLDHDIKGTVGAVVRDKNGHLAAATSTGGMTNKLPGRVGDSALIGAGTWAWDKTCAVSATGHGERFIRTACAARLSSLIDLAGLGVEAAADRLVHQELMEMDARGGLIAVDPEGNWAMPYNDGGMLRGVLTEDGVARVGIWDDLQPA